MIRFQSCRCCCCQSWVHVPAWHMTGQATFVSDRPEDQRSVQLRPTSCCCPTLTLQYKRASVPEVLGTSLAIAGSDNTGVLLHSSIRLACSSNRSMHCRSDSTNEKHDHGQHTSRTVVGLKHGNVRWSKPFIRVFVDLNIAKLCTGYLYEVYVSPGRHEAGQTRTGSLLR